MPALKKYHGSLHQALNHIDLLQQQEVTISEQQEKINMQNLVIEKLDQEVSKIVTEHAEEQKQAEQLRRKMDELCGQLERAQTQTPGPHGAPC